MNAPARTLAKRWTTLAVLALGLLFACGALQGQTRAGRSEVGGAHPVSLLWVGNSFFYSNNSMHSHVESLTLAADATSQTHGVSVTISGSGLDWHDIASYSISIS